MIKYFIRTTGERTLDSSIYRELGEDFTLLVDKEHKPVKSFIEQLNIISEYDSILLEDDVQLCRNFKERIEEVVKEYPGMIINFFTFPGSFCITHKSKSFCYNQCTYYPKGISRVLSEEMNKILQKETWTQYGLLEGQALRNLKTLHLVYRPCLVQHLDRDTLIQDKCDGSRRCIYFVDYLDDLNIDYNKAYKFKTQLYEYMNTKL